MRLAGVDGCKGGWVAVLAPMDDPGAASSVFLSDVRELFSVYGAGFAVIDIPVGFATGPEPRDVEQAMRKRLPGKTSSVFSTPCRAALAEMVYSDASHVNREHLGVGLSKQSFELFPKMREIDRVAVDLGQDRLREGHPEVSFAEMNGLPVLSRKRKPDGQAERIALLEKHGFPAAALAKGAKGLGCGIDDVLDATVLLWSAMRFQRGQHAIFPATPSRDALGLEMSVIA
jgi:predicted RNase H-like nuclease